MTAVPSAVTRLLYIGDGGEVLKLMPAFRPKNQLLFWCWDLRVEKIQSVRKIIKNSGFIMGYFDKKYKKVILSLILH